MIDRTSKIELPMHVCHFFPVSFDAKCSIAEPVFYSLYLFTNFGNNNSGSVGFGPCMYTGSVDLLFSSFY